MIGGVGERRVLAIVVPFRGGKLAGRVHLWSRVLWWIVAVGFELVCRQVQEEQLSKVSRDSLE